MTVKTTSKYKSRAFEAIHSAAEGLYSSGTITKTTMREFDDSCLAQVPMFDANDIKRIREQAHVSQTLFARYLNTSESTVQKWETGQKHPSGMALKLLSVVEKHGLQVLA